MDPLAVLGGVSAIAQLVEQSLAILQRTREAVNRMKNDAAYLAMVSEDLSGVVALIQAVVEEPALQQESIREGISSLLTRAERLDVFVKELERKSQKGNILSRFTFQLVKAPSEQTLVVEGMKRLSQAKMTLMGQIQVLPVGLTAGGEGVIVNLVLVNHIDTVLQRLEGTNSGLRIAQLLRNNGMPTDAGGEVRLSHEDATTLVNLASVAAVGEAVGEATGGDLLEVINNTADEFSFMPNAPIGNGTNDNDAVYTYKTVRVRGNVAKKYSTMINHPISQATLDKANNHQMALARAMKGFDP